MRVELKQLALACAALVLAHAPAAAQQFDGMMRQGTVLTADVCSVSTGTIFDTSQDTSFSLVRALDVRADTTGATTRTYRYFAGSFDPARVNLEDEGRVWMIRAQEAAKEMAQNGIPSTEPGGLPARAELVLLNGNQQDLCVALLDDACGKYLAPLDLVAYCGLER